MAVTVAAKNYSLINACILNTTWTGSSPANVDDFYKEGTRCIGFTMKTSGVNDTYINTGGPWNLSGKHLHMWWMCTALKELATESAGGLQIMLTDGTNTGYWNMTGSDTYPGGWLNLVLDCDRSPSSGSQPTMTNITQVGFRVNLTIAAKNVQNTWVDHVYVADGLVAYGDLSGSPFSFADILAADENTTYGWGMIRKIGGVYFLVGSLEFGDSAGTALLDFYDTGQVVVFENRPVSTSVYGITVVGNSTGACSFTLGAKSGSAGISGCTIQTASQSQTPKFYITATDTDIDVFQLYGCRIVDANSIALPTRDGTNPTYREVVSTNFESCNVAMVVSSCPVNYCTFVSSAGVAVQIDSPTHYVDHCSFIACQTGVKLTAQGTYNFTNMAFTGCTYDVENSVASTVVTSNTTNDSTQQLYSGAVVGVAQSWQSGSAADLTNVTLYLRKTGSPTGNAYVKLYAHSGTYGTSSIPTGTALATSKAINVADLTTGYVATKIEFDDSEFYTLGASTYYTIAIEYSGGDSSNRLEVAYNSTTVHGGNKATLTGAVWTAQSGHDLYFYVRTGGDVTIGSTASNPAVFNNSGTPPGVTNANAAVTVKVTVRDSDLALITGARVYLKADAGGDLTEGTVILNDVTTGTGIVQDTNFNYTNDQPVIGWVRKSTSAPLYKTAPLSGTILSTGFSTVAVMTADE